MECYQVILQKAFSVQNVGIIMIFLAIIWIVIMLVAFPCSEPLNTNCPTGWIAVTGAATIFGATGIPMKVPEFEGGSEKTDETLEDSYEENDPMIFACYVGIGIFLVSFPLMIYIGILSTSGNNQHSFHYSPWSILGSIDIFIIN